MSGAAGARARARAGRGWRTGRRRWSLRTRLVVSAVTLIAVVCAVIGTVTTVALSSSLSARLDDESATSLQRSLGPESPRHHGLPPHPGTGGGQDGDSGQNSGRDGSSSRKPGGARDVRFAAMPGQPIGTIGARKDGDGRLTAAARSIDRTDGTAGSGTDPADRLHALTAEQTRALSRVPADGAPHTVSVPGLGDYRVRAGQVPGGDGSLLVGLPMGEMQSTLGTLIVVEVCVTGAGLVAAGAAGTVLVRVALRPLRRVAATATRVAQLRLHRGEVTLPHRVPEADTDPRTEVGQVGAALNRMLGHVGSALEARQESETRVRRFVADASHELRTPLASIRGYAELTRRLRESPPSANEDRGEGPGPGLDPGREAEEQRALDRIESEAARMTGLVEDLLLLARLDAGRPLERAPVDLSALVVDAVGDARAAGPGHVWRLELPPEPVGVRGDRARLQQVLVNLLANARTHTPEGTAVTARVRATEAAGAGPCVDSLAGAGGCSDGCAGAGTRGEVTVEVEDAGPGIPEEMLPHIFERFARGDAGRSRAHGSTGLGLAIVEAVVTAHDGRVYVRSEPGRTVFAVRLPADDAAPGDVAPGGVAPEVDGTGSGTGTGRPGTDSQPEHRLSTRS